MSQDIEAIARLSQLRQENARLRRAKELRVANGISFYRPHWKQHKFHTSSAVGRYGRTGNRFGKSEMGVAEDIAWCMGGRIWYRESFNILDGKQECQEIHLGGREHPYIRLGIPDRPVKGLLLVENWKVAKKIFTNRDGSPDMWGKLFRMLPHASVGKCTRSTGGDIVQIEIKRPTEFGGGSSTLTIDTIQSYKNSPQSAESADWDFIHVDEPCPEDMFKAHSRGLSDRNGSYWFTCTPLDEMWINDKFTPQKGMVVDESGGGTGFETKFILTGSIYDNPYRNEDGVKEFESGLTREERECRLYGLPLAMAGLVYKEFIYDMHVLADVPEGWNEYWLPPKDYTIRVAWDVHGARVPQAVLFVATAPTGDAFVYDEMFFEPLIGPNAELLKRKLEGRFVVDQIIDPRALIVNPVTRTADVIDAIAEHGLFFEPASKDLTSGISRVKERLNERNVASKLPTIWFSPRLERTLWEFTHYVYDLKKNEPKDGDDHMMENLYRLVLNGLSFIKPPTKADYAFRRNMSIGTAEDRRSFARA